MGLMFLLMYVLISIPHLINFISFQSKSPPTILRLFFSVSVSPNIHPPASGCLPVRPSLCLVVLPPIHLFIHPPVCPSMAGFPAFLPSVFTSGRPSVGPLKCSNDGRIIALHLGNFSKLKLYFFLKMLR